MIKIGSIVTDKPARNYFACLACGWQESHPHQNGDGLILEYQGCPKCGVKRDARAHFAATEPPAWWKEPSA